MAGGSDEEGNLAILYSIYSSKERFVVNIFILFMKKKKMKVYIVSILVGINAPFATSSDPRPRTFIGQKTGTMEGMNNNGCVDGADWEASSASSWCAKSPGSCFSSIRSHIIGFS